MFGPGGVFECLTDWEQLKYLLLLFVIWFVVVVFTGLLEALSYNNPKARKRFEEDRKIAREMSNDPGMTYETASKIVQLKEQNELLEKIANNKEKK